MGRFGFLEFETANEECIEVLAVDPESQTFDARAHGSFAGRRPATCRENVSDAFSQSRFAAQMLTGLTSLNLGK